MSSAIEVMEHSDILEGLQKHVRDRLEQFLGVVEDVDLRVALHFIKRRSLEEGLNNYFSCEDAYKEAGIENPKNNAPATTTTSNNKSMTTNTNNKDGGNAAATNSNNNANNSSANLNTNKDKKKNNVSEVVRPTAPVLEDEEVLAEVGQKRKRSISNLPLSPQTPMATNKKAEENKEKEGEEPKKKKSKKGEVQRGKVPLPKKAAKAGAKNKEVAATDGRKAAKKAENKQPQKGKKESQKNKKKEKKVASPKRTLKKVASPKRTLKKVASPKRTLKNEPGNTQPVGMNEKDSTSSSSDSSSSSEPSSGADSSIIDESEATLTSSSSSEHTDTGGSRRRPAGRGGARKARPRILSVDEDSDDDSVQEIDPQKQKGDDDEEGEKEEEGQKSKIKKKAEEKKKNPLLLLGKKENADEDDFKGRTKGVLLRASRLSKAEHSSIYEPQPQQERKKAGLETMIKAEAEYLKMAKGLKSVESAVPENAKIINDQCREIHQEVVDLTCVRQFLDPKVRETDCFRKVIALRKPKPAELAALLMAACPSVKQEPFPHMDVVRALSLFKLYLGQSILPEETVKKMKIKPQRGKNKGAGSKVKKPAVEETTIKLPASIFTCTHTRQGQGLTSKLHQDHGAIRQSDFYQKPFYLGGTAVPFCSSCRHRRSEYLCLSCGKGFCVNHYHEHDNVVDHNVAVVLSSLQNYVEKLVENVPGSIVDNDKAVFCFRCSTYRRDDQLEEHLQPFGLDIGSINPEMIRKGENEETDEFLEQEEGEEANEEIGEEKELDNSEVGADELTELQRSIITNIVTEQLLDEDGNAEEIEEEADPSDLIGRYVLADKWKTQTQPFLRLACHKKCKHRQLARILDSFQFMNKLCFAELSPITITDTKCEVTVTFYLSSCRPVPLSNVYIGNVTREGFMNIWEYMHLIKSEEEEDQQAAGNSPQSKTNYPLSPCFPNPQEAATTTTTTTTTANVMSPTTTAASPTLEGMSRNNAVLEKTFPYVTSDDIEAISQQCTKIPTHSAMLNYCASNNRDDAIIQYEAVSDIKLTLKTHQKAAVRWMVEREQNPLQDFLPFKIRNRHGETLFFYYSPITLQLIIATENIGHYVNPPIRGGILADEMGLGKTLSVLSLIAANPRPRDAPKDVEFPSDLRWVKLVAPGDKDCFIYGTNAYKSRHLLHAIKATLIVVPVSICGQWISEIGKCYPKARVILFHGMGRHSFKMHDFEMADIILTTYETLGAQVTAESNGIESLVPHFHPYGSRRSEIIYALNAFIRLKEGNTQRDTHAFRKLDIPGYMNPNNTYADQRNGAKLIADFLKTAAYDPMLTRLKFHRIVLDESQKASVAHSNFWRLQATCRWIVSGTPISSTYRSLGNYFNFLGCMPYTLQGYNAFTNCDATHSHLQQTGYFRENSDRNEKVNTPFNESFATWRRFEGYRQPKSNPVIDSYSHEWPSWLPKHHKHRTPFGEIGTERFRHMWIVLFLLQHYMLRHIKNEQINEELALPPRSMITHKIDLTETERKLYEKVAQRVQADYEGLASRERVGNRIGRVMMWMLHVRRMAVHPLLLQTADLLSETNNAYDEDSTARQNENAKHNITSLHPAAAKEKFLGTGHGKIPEVFKEMMDGFCGDPPEVPECMICTNPLQQPVVLTCFHAFCRECVFAIISEAQKRRDAPKCPCCRQATVAKPKIQVSVTAASTSILDDESEEYWKQAAQRVGDGSKSLKIVSIVREIMREDPTAKFVIFTSFPQMMQRLSKLLASNNFPNAIIDGSTSLMRRANIITDFQGQHSTLKVCLLSSRAGSAGLTLTAANHLILVEPNLNTSVDAQAMGRIHRVGQTRPITIHRVIYNNSIEEKITKLVDENRLVSQGGQKSGSGGGGEHAMVVELNYLLANGIVPPQVDKSVVESTGSPSGGGVTPSGVASPPWQQQSQPMPRELTEEEQMEQMLADEGVARQLMAEMGGEFGDELF